MLLILVIACLLVGQVNASAHVCMADTNNTPMQHHDHHMTDMMMADMPSNDSYEMDCCKTVCQCAQSGCSVSTVAIMQKQMMLLLSPNDRIVILQNNHLSLALNPAYKPPISA